MKNLEFKKIAFRIEHAYGLHMRFIDISCTKHGLVFIERLCLDGYLSSWLVIGTRGYSIRVRVYLSYGSEMEGVVFRVSRKGVAHNKFVYKYNELLKCFRNYERQVYFSTSAYGIVSLEEAYNLRTGGEFILELV